MLDFFKNRSRNPKDDLLSGLTVALALVPEAVAFAFVAGVPPIIGLYSAFFMGLITAAIGGRPGMISGATGAMAVVVVTLVAQHGIEYLFPAVMLCGVIQILVGLGKLGKLIRMVPHSVMLGFVNGLAIVIGMAQLSSFKTVNAQGHLAFMAGPALFLMLAMVGLTMLIIWLLPKLTRAVPASLAAILTVTLVSLGINHFAPANWAAPNQQNVLMTVGDMLLTNEKAAAVAKQAEAWDGPTVDPATATPVVGAVHSGEQAGVGGETQVAADGGQTVVEADAHGASQVVLPEAVVAQAMAEAEQNNKGIQAGVPLPFFLDKVSNYDFAGVFSWAGLMIIFPYALTLAGVGLIESLMTLTLIDEITETRGRGNRECIGQGVANLTSGFFGGMGGCAMIGQSLINVNSGGRGRLSGITAAVCLLSFVLVLAPWIEMIPMAALTGVMFMVVIGTFEWASLKTFGKVPKSDILVMVLVAGYTVFMHDLASAVILGVIVAALVFAWNHATHLFADVKHNEFGSKIYQLHGPLFFASISSFKELFDPKNDPDDVVIDFYYTRVYDQSGLEAINGLAEKYRSLGKRLHLTHLSPECRDLLDKAGDLVEVNVSEDPQYHVVTDRLG